MLGPNRHAIGLIRKVSYDIHIACVRRKIAIQPHLVHQYETLIVYRVNVFYQPIPTPKSSYESFQLRSHLWTIALRRKFLLPH